MYPYPVNPAVNPLQQSLGKIMDYGMTFPAMPNFRGNVVYLDPASKTVGWDAERAKKSAMAEGRPQPLILMREHGM